jgi:peptidoglycan biosynthesis protein MviN/MurJ (putative lipid II flippase)
MDAYRITGSLLTIGTQLLLVQLLPVIFVPLFTSIQSQSGEREAWRITAVLGASITLALIGLYVLVVLAPGETAWILGPGLSAAGHNAAVAFAPVMLGGVVMLTWCGTVASVMNCYGIFWTAAATPLLINVGIIVSVLVSGSRLPVEPIKLGISAGCVAAVVVHCVYILRLTRGLRSFRRMDVAQGVRSGWTQAWSCGLPLVAGACCLQLFNILSVDLASSAREARWPLASPFAWLG